MSETYDYIIIGSGAGGAAAAYRLGAAGARVLMLEKGDPLPMDGSTLDPAAVIRRGAFLSREPWLDRSGLLAVRRFPVEDDFARIAAGLGRRDSRWRCEPLAVGLAANILESPAEARHFDAFASVAGLKSDAQNCLIERTSATVKVRTGSAVSALVPDPADPRRLTGVACEDASHYRADAVLLAAGALHSPRLFQRYMRETGLAYRLPCADLVGRYYKCHLLTALLAFGHRPVRDVLCKTALLLHESFPYSSVQTLGGNLAEEIVRAQAPVFAERMAGPFARRAYGFFLQTEDGSHPDNRVVEDDKGPPRLDHDFARLPAARDEHRRLVRYLSKQLLRLGYLPVAKSIPASGTAHACGTMVAGTDEKASVVDPQGKVHGMENLYVVDGSILPRSSRVNPASSIFAWSLRVADRLAGSRIDETATETSA